MNFDKEQDIIILGLKKLISDNGPNVFDEPRRAKALIADYLPQLSTPEKNLINISCECGIYKMIVHSTSNEDRNVYMKAKSLLVDDYMIAESAAEKTIERIFKACGKTIPNVVNDVSTDVQNETQNKNSYNTAIIADTNSFENSFQQRILADKSGEFEEKVLKWVDGVKKCDRILQEPLSLTQRFKLQAIMVKLNDVQEQMQKLVNQGRNTYLLESQVVPLYKDIDLCTDEIDDFEREVLNSQPKEINCIAASMQICSRNCIFYMQTFLGSVSYIAKVCLLYNGKQYVVAQMPPTNVNTVFVVYNNMLIPDTDAEAVNYLINYCQAKGLLN